MIREKWRLEFANILNSNIKNEASQKQVHEEGRR